MKQLAAAEWVQDRYVNNTIHLLKAWGCNRTCVNSFGEGDEWNLAGAIEQCKCPTGIKYNVTNEPFADADIE